MNKNKMVTKELFNLITRLKKANIFANNEAEGDIRPSEEMFLIKISMLLESDSVRVNDLVTTFKFAPSTVSTILKSLEGNGYITRTINEDNRREVFVNITEKGKVRLNKARKHHIAMLDDLISYLQDEDLIKLIDVLEKTVCFFEERQEERTKQS